MNKIVYFVIFILILSACGQQEEQENSGGLEKHEGIIVKELENSKGHPEILVITEAGKEAITSMTTRELHELSRINGGAYYNLRSIQNKELKLGEQVIVHWDGNQSESSPPQRKAEKVEIVSE